MSRSGPEWFAPKRFGYGSGLPISWQGWTLLIGYIVITVVVSTTLAKRPIQFLAVVVPLTAAFMVVCARTTRGGWRWRSGTED